MFVYALYILNMFYMIIVYYIYIVFVYVLFSLIYNICIRGLSTDFNISVLNIT